MIKEILKLTLLWVVLILLQTLVLNQLQFAGIINPYLYVLFMLTLPVGLSRMMVLLLGFLTGLTIDIFSNTPGMHAAACVWLAFFRPIILTLLSTRGTYPEMSWPSYNSFGALWYLKYSTIMVLIHHSFLFLVEQFDYTHLIAVILRILFSSLATLLFVYVAQFFLPVQSDRR